MANRQTVWLSTMMILSLMLIGYYTVGQNIQPIPTAKDAVSKDDTAKAPEPAQTTVDNKKQDGADTKGTADKQDQATGTEASDYFIAYHLKEKNRIAEEIANLQNKITNVKTPSDEVAKAQKQVEELQALTEKQEMIVQQIQAEGYPDAIVTKGDADTYKVVVQAQDLKNEEVVKIMSIIKNQLNVLPADVVVSYHQ